MCAQKQKKTKRLRKSAKRCNTTAEWGGELTRRFAAPVAMAAVRRGPSSRYDARSTQQQV